MNFEIYKSFSDLFYSAHYVPVFCYNNADELLFSCTSLEELEPPYAVRKKLSASNPPTVFFSTETGFYGKIEIKSNSGYIIVGPVFSGNITVEILQGFMNAHTIEHKKSDNVFDFLSNIPRYSYNRFLNMLAFLHFSLNGEQIDIISHFDFANSVLEKNIAEVSVESTYQAKEETIQHNTYYFEKQMLDLVSQGNVERMAEFLANAIRFEKPQEGKLADNPLRQAKNLFIGLITIIGKYGAIKGGLDIEQTYQLIDTYIQECEKMISLDSIKVLQYNMIIDFTRRVAENKIPDGISEDIFKCIQFINNHTNDMIGISEVVSHIGKSKTYTTEKFKKEMGVTINEYIINQKLIEAKSLLKHSTKSLTEISYYLCFSSQSYFQNLFKKKYGVTPQKYRDKFVK